MHVLPRVRQLHERFPDVLTVIGVHAGKFPTERRTDRLADACARLGVTHPVVNDRHFRIWRDYAVQAWPTIALIDTEGRLVDTQAGEFQVSRVAEQIQAIAARANQRGTLTPGMSDEPPVAPRGGDGLRFPTRAVIFGETLWVSDTGNRRVLECAWRDGHAAVKRVYDGFEEPRGIAPTEDGAFVADRRGQRVLFLSGGEVSVMAGTGDLSDHRVREGDPYTELRSPWGLHLAEDRLWITMAGSHELWSLDLSSRRLVHVAGNGHENIFDGPHRQAALAQPTGIDLADNRDTPLAIADCETSAVRLVDADNVRTLVGTDLFDFGDRLGRGDEALQQHCEDVAWHAGQLALADTYNDRVKLIDPATRGVTPWPGEIGEPGSLREPAGISSAGNGVLVCDTGNHRLVRAMDHGDVREVTLG